jgi:hypothetical protein
MSALGQSRPRYPASKPTFVRS